MSSPFEDPTYDEDSTAFRWGCILGDKCLMPDPEHFSSECHSVKDIEAFFAADDLDAHYSGLERLEDVT